MKKIPGFIVDVIKEAFSYLCRKTKEWISKKIKSRSPKELIKEISSGFLEQVRSLSLRSKALIAAFAVLFVCFCLLHSYTAGHFLPGTRINGIDVSGMSISQVRNELTERCGQYVLNIYEADGKTETIKGSDIDLEIVISKDFDNILKIRNGYFWIGSVMKNESVDVGDTVSYKYDESLLEEMIDKLDCLNVITIKKPANAELYYKDGEFVIRDAVFGNEIDKAKLETLVKNAVRCQQTSINLAVEGVYDSPEILSDDPVLLAEKAAFNELKGIDISLRFGGATEVIDPEKAANWYSVNKDSSITLNDSLLAQYVDVLADKYDTLSSPKLFVTSSGDTVEISNSYYGWQLDREYAVQTLKSYLSEKKSAVIDLTDRSEESDKWWLKTAVAYDDLGYYGNTYAEVSIDGQYMWMYQNGEAVFESDVVTGRPDSEHDTPIGIYSIIYKEQNATLRGDDYETEVAYWMVFTYDIGFHDADWQYAFGDDMYEYNGSHGCVNLPVERAAELYDLVYPGMPVFVY